MFFIFFKDRYCIASEAKKAKVVKFDPRPNEDRKFLKQTLPLKLGTITAPPHQTLPLKLGVGGFPKSMQHHQGIICCYI
jgi:hypothetical protein